MPNPSHSQFASFNSVGSGSSFPNPFSDIASSMVPDTWRNTLYWCEEVYSFFGTYSAAMERVISYFLTEVEITGDTGEDEKTKYKELCNDVYGVMSVLQSLLRDRACYGNSFATVIVPFRRFLTQPHTGDSFPLHVVFNNSNFAFEWSNFQFIATCPRTGWRGPWKVDDRPDNVEKNIKIKRWSPHQIELLHDPLTNDVDYIWRIPEDYKSMIRAGNLFHLERATKEILKAVELNRVFRFNKGVMFHMREPTLAGIQDRGWGIPRILVNFRQIWHLQVLRRQNESIGMDFVVPWRVITPSDRSSGGNGAAGKGAADPFMVFNGNDFRTQINSMTRRRRKDPAAVHTLGFPINYQLLGGEATKMAPTELIEQATQTLLNDSGVPVDLFNGSLELQVAPVALRLFESIWSHMLRDSNMFLAWLIEQSSQILSWEKVKATLRTVAIADDMQKQMAALQLMMGQQLSGTTGLKSVGFDWNTEQNLIAEEAKIQQKIQARQQEEMQQAGFAQEIAAGGAGQQQQGGGGGGAPQQGGGNPAGPDAASAMGAGNMPVTEYLKTMNSNAMITPEDLMATASQLANELLGLPESVKDSQLRELKKSNEVLHSLVKANMDKIRQGLNTQGGAMLKQQQFGG